jgi:alpha-L-fucosidase
MRPAALGAALGAVLAALVLAAPAAAYDATKKSLDTHPLPAWWRDAKFGIFIHWGPASVPAWTLPNGLAGFWYWLEQQVPGTPTWLHHLQTYGPDVTYDDLFARFTAAKYDPTAWIGTFKAAGAKYFLLTTKHHDGFALWCSKTSRRDACDMGPRRDLVGPLVRAARKRGIKAGLYYSIPEWFSPAARPMAANVVSSALSMQPAPAGVLGDAAFNLRARNAYTQVPVPYTGYTPISDYGAGQVRPQLDELIDTYHPDEIWCDIGGAESYFKSNATIATFYNAAATTNPGGVVVNDRCGDGNTHVDFASVEQGNGYTIGTQTIDKPTETDRAIGSWFYSDANTDASLPTRPALLGELVTAVSLNSNYVLNISPRADGTLPEPIVSRLAYIGRWLKINGHAIYGSRPWSQGADDNNANTRFTVGRDGAFYVTTLGWPGKQLRVAAPIPVPDGARLELLGGDGTALTWRREGKGVVIDLPSADMTKATRSEGAATIRIDKKERAR